MVSEFDDGIDNRRPGDKLTWYYTPVDSNQQVVEYKDVRIFCSETHIPTFSPTSVIISFLIVKPSDSCVATWPNPKYQTPNPKKKLTETKELKILSLYKNFKP